MTLQEILDSVLLESGIGTETSYAGNGDEAVTRLVYLANRAADYLASCYPWQGLRKVYTFTVEAGVDTYAMPEDFRQLVSDTVFSTSYMDSIDIMTDPGVWRYMKVNGVATGPRQRFRIIGNTIQIQDPIGGDEVSFEYVSKYAVRSSAGAEKQRFTADTDTFVLDDDMLILDAAWRYQRLIGKAEWQDTRNDATKRKVQAQGQDAGVKTLMAGEYSEPMGEPYTPLWVNNA